jgi:hypothetical protein
MFAVVVLTTFQIPFKAAIIGQKQTSTFQDQIVKNVYYLTHNQEY